MVCTWLWNNAYRRHWQKNKKFNRTADQIVVHLITRYITPIGVFSICKLFKMTPIGILNSERVKTSSYVLISVQLIFCIFLKHQISRASNIYCSFFIYWKLLRCIAVLGPDYPNCHTMFLTNKFWVMSIALRFAPMMSFIVLYWIFAAFQ